MPNYIFLTMYSNSYSINLRIFCPCLSFSFPLPLFPFIFLSHFPFVLFFFLYFPLFFSFPNLHHFLNLVCHFLRAPLPCSRTFCCPGLWAENFQIWWLVSWKFPNLGACELKFEWKLRLLRLKFFCLKWDPCEQQETVKRGSSGPLNFFLQP